MASALFFGSVFSRCRLPRVLGEIFGGILLGPTVLGAPFPEGRLFSFFSWFGLAALMFISGFEIQKTFERRDRKIITAVLLGSIILPFCAGLFFPLLAGTAGLLGMQRNVPALQLVCAAVVAVTSIPVISKIFIDLKIIHTRFAKVVLITATLHDVLLWLALAVIMAMVNTSGVFVPAVSGALGAFLAGIALGLMPAGRFQKARARIKGIALALAVPLYFALVGFKIDLIHSFDPRLFFLFLVFATSVSIAGTLIAARAVINDWLSSFNLAVAMNSRGAMGIVLASMAFKLGVISEAFFVTLVLVSLLSSLFAGFWLRYMVSRGERLLS